MEENEIEINENDIFEGEYEYHKGAVHNILAFEVFKRKYLLLKKLKESYMNNKTKYLERKIEKLCEELGYYWFRS